MSAYDAAVDKTVDAELRVEAAGQEAIDETVSLEARKVAAKLNTAGKYEPELRENGIPDDVLQ